VRLQYTRTKLWDAWWLFCFSLPLSFGRVSHAAAMDSMAADFQHSTVVDSMPDSQHSTVADFIRAFANFMGSMTAIFANSMTTDLITMASAAGLLWSPLSAAGGGAADGVGPNITIHPEAITGTDLIRGIGALIRRATTPMWRNVTPPGRPFPQAEAVLFWSNRRRRCRCRSGKWRLDRPSAVVRSEDGNRLIGTFNHS
jgi:hypothetical protein